MRRIIKAIHVRAIRASATRGILVIGHLVIPCALGRSGCRAIKREGDGASPLGHWRLEMLMWRPDRTRQSVTALPGKPLSVCPESS